MPSIATQIAVNTALVVPPLKDAYWRRQRNAGGYDGARNEPERLRTQFERHAAEHRALIGEITGDVLELGPGGSIGVALQFLGAGARSVTCIDVEPLLSGTAEEYDALVPGGSALKERITYRCPDSVTTTDLPSGSFDFVYSGACLEHIDDPAAAVRTIARVLKPGGATSHQIDMRDHTDFDRPLDFLRYSDRAWKMATSRRIYTNRWRMSDWISAFRREGLVVDEERTTANILAEVSDTDRVWMHERFASRPLDDLSAVGLWIVATKPA